MKGPFRFSELIPGDRLRPVIVGVLILSALLFSFIGCAKKSGGDLDTALTLYRQNKLNDALPLFEKAALDDSTNAEILCWLAETYRRLNLKDAAVQAAHKALTIDSCSSFAYTVLADALNPMYGAWDQASEDSSWSCLMKAIACDSTDGNAWLSVWSQSIKWGDPDLEKRSLQALISTGILSPGILAYNRWVLQNLPQDAMLLTNGDMDTYPAVAVQEVEKFRPDVAVVNYSLLNTTWYDRYIRDKFNIPLPYSDTELEQVQAFSDTSGKVTTIASQIMSGWLAMRQKGTLKRPVAIAATVSDLSFATDSQDHLCLMGPYKLWLPQPATTDLDTAAVRKSLLSINPDDYTATLASIKDRSPVRYSTADKIVTNITALALQYSRKLIDAGRKQDALAMLDWADAFENKSFLGPVLADEIAKLRESAR